MISLNYDHQYDILYIGFADKSNSDGEEFKNGFVLLTDADSNEITGLTIFDFMKKYENGALKATHIPIKIDYDTDVLPFIK